jgi:hypothetical protein
MPSSSTLGCRADRSSQPSQSEGQAQAPDGGQAADLHPEAVCPSADDSRQPPPPLLTRRLSSRSFAALWVTLSALTLSCGPSLTRRDPLFSSGQIRHFRR